MAAATTVAALSGYGHNARATSSPSLDVAAGLPPSPTRGKLGHLVNTLLEQQRHALPGRVPRQVFRTSAPCVRFQRGVLAWMLSALILDENLVVRAVRFR
jgi:hypothetical protein